jgi:hypothetical protein
VVVVMVVVVVIGLRHDCLLVSKTKHSNWDDVHRPLHGAL